MVPSALNRPTGCDFHPRCDFAVAGRCDRLDPPDVDLGNGHSARCVLAQQNTEAANG